MATTKLFLNPSEVMSAIIPALEIHVSHTHDELTSYINDNPNNFAEYVNNFAFAEVGTSFDPYSVRDILNQPNDILEAILEVARFNLVDMCDYDLACVMYAYYRINESDFNNDILELDMWDGTLGDDRCYSMWEFDDILHGKTPTEIAEMIEDNDFSTRHDYFKFTIWGVESTDYPDYSDYLSIDNCADILDNATHLDLCAFISDLIAEYNDAKAEADE